MFDAVDRFVNRITPWILMISARYIGGHVVVHFLTH